MENDTTREFTVKFSDDEYKRILAVIERLDDMPVVFFLRNSVLAYVDKIEYEVLNADAALANIADIGKELQA